MTWTACGRLTQPTFARTWMASPTNWPRAGRWRRVGAAHRLGEVRKVVLAGMGASAMAGALAQAYAAEVASGPW